MMNKITQLSEAVKDTGKGKIHTAEPGGYGRKDDEDDEGNKVKAAAKKGRGRPKKDADSSTGEEKKYDAKGLSSVFGGKAPKSTKKGTVIKGKSQSHAANKEDDGTGDEEPKSKKKGLKEYFDSLDKALNEALTPAQKDEFDKKYPPYVPFPGYKGKNKQVTDEAEQIQIKPASQMPKTAGQTAGATSQPGQPQQVAGQPAQNTQVIAQGNKTLGTVNNPQLAQQIKQSIGKGEMTLMPDEMDEGILDTVKKVGGKVLDKLGHGSDEDLLKDLQRKAGIPAHAQHGKPAMAKSNDDLDEVSQGLATRAFAKRTADAFERGDYSTSREDDAEADRASAKADKTYDRIGKRFGSDAQKQADKAADKEIFGDRLNEKDIGKHNNATTGFDALVRKLTPKYGVEAAKRIAGSQMKKIKEADIPPHDSLASPLSMEESKKSKPDFLDMDKDGNKKESMKKAVADKKKVDESMDQRLQAARLEGKAHGLKGHSHCGKNYDDMEEARCYHEGYKEGLDECYGQMPIQGYVGENDTVNDMASYGAHTPSIADEGNAFTGALNRTPNGGKFSVGGKTFTDRSSIEESPFAFEALEQQLNALLESETKVAEGMTVSISKGQQGSPDSVSVSAQDGEADQLLQLIKSAGLGLFGGEESNGYGAPQGSTGAPGGIEVVDDHDGMMALMKKLTGQGGDAGGSEDYADEEGSEPAHSHEEDSCNECGMAYESCGCDHENKEMVDEVESEDQMTYNVAEDNPPDNGSANSINDEEGNAAANQAADGYDQAESEDEAASDDAVEEDSEPGVEEGAESNDEEQVEESLANGADDTFESDIDFMTNVISGGLNKRKSTGQSTIPVVGTQLNRMHSHDTSDINESVNDWKKLAGIK